jgi:hypothetical protein
MVIGMSDTWGHVIVPTVVFSPLTYVRARVKFEARVKSVCCYEDAFSSLDRPVVGGGMFSIDGIAANWWGHLPLGM